MEKNSFEQDNLFGRKKKKTKSFVPQTPGVPSPKIMVAPDGKLMKKVSTVSAPPKAAKKKKKKKLLKKVGKGIAKVAKKVAKGGQKAIKAVGKLATKATLLPLIPLMPVMGAALKRKGISPPKGIEARAELFYNKVVRSSNYETKEILFTGNSYEDNHLAVDIVEAIVKFIKGVKERKKKGVELDPVEQIVATGTDQVLKKITRKKGVKQAVSEMTMGDPESNIKTDDEPTSSKVVEKETSKSDNKKLLMYGGGGLVALVLLVLAFRNS